MAPFVKTSTGHVNIEKIARIEQALGGEYRIRWSDGMMQVISRDDGDAIMQAIHAPDPMIAALGNASEAGPKRKRRKEQETKQA